VFLRTFGVVFLGEPRTQEAAKAHEVGWPMMGSMLAFGGLCLVLGVGAPLGLYLVQSPCQVFLWTDERGTGTDQLAPLLGQIGVTGAVLLGLVASLTLLRRLLLRGRTVTESGTWGCGYAYPLPRMQYTASSFAEPLLALFARIVRLRIRAARPNGPFPPAGAYATQAEDLAEHGLFQPLFEGIQRLAGWLRWFQQGYIQIYLLYIFGTLIVLLLWQLGQ
jgi:NADH:ubiquinone oxidoreductase subunit 5 (subunit L)/multisubunit Na+/H+ antiporter MnhA subunit